MDGAVVIATTTLVAQALITVLLVAILAALIVLERMRERRTVELENRVASLEALLIERQCRECGCTDDAGCLFGCWWVELDLCSSHPDAREAGSSLEGGRG